MNILILMDMPLFPYRIYAYNELSNRGYDLTVISVSDEDTRYDLPLKFEHIRLEKKAIGGFVKLEHFSQIEPNKYDVIVVDPNLRMLDYYQFYRNKYWDKLIGWGITKGVQLEISWRRSFALHSSKNSRRWYFMIIRQGTNIWNMGSSPSNPMWQTILSMSIFLWSI